MKTTKFLILTDDVDHDGCTDEQHKRIRHYGYEQMVFVSCIHPKWEDNVVLINGNEYVRDSKGMLTYFCDVLTREDAINGFERGVEDRSPPSGPEEEEDDGHPCECADCASRIVEVGERIYHSDPQLDAMYTLLETREWNGQDRDEIMTYINARKRELGI